MWTRGEDHKIAISLRKLPWGDFYNVDVYIYFDRWTRSLTETSADVYFDGRGVLGDYADLGFRAVDFHPGEWTLSEGERQGTFVTLIVDRLVPAIEPLGSREGLIDFVRSRNAVRALTIVARRELGFPEDV